MTKLITLWKSLLISGSCTGSQESEGQWKESHPWLYFLMGEHSITGTILLFSICMHMNTHRQHSNMIKIIAECCLGFRLFFSCGLNNCFSSYQFLVQANRSSSILVALIFKTATYLTNRNAFLVSCCMMWLKATHTLCHSCNHCNYVVSALVGFHLEHSVCSQ